MKVASSDCFFGDHRKAGALLQRRHELRNVLDDFAVQARFTQHSLCYRPVTPLWREDQRSLGNGVGHSASDSNKVGRCSTSSGTPRRTPWKPISGSPSVTPRLSMRYSRI